MAATAQHSPTVHTVEFDLGNEHAARVRDQRDVWRWVAYSVFSRDADHNIHTLKLSLERFKNAEVDAIREILQASNPLAVLQRYIGKPPTVSAPRQLVASKFMLGEHSSNNVVPFQTKSGIAVRVLETPKDRSFPWWSVLLPGFGQAFVHEDDVHSTSTAALLHVNRHPATAPSFQHIEIVMSDTSSDRVAALLELIGQNTKRIDVQKYWGVGIANEWCERVLAACLGLEELRLANGNIGMLDMSAVAAEEGRVRLRALEISVKTANRAANVRRFFDAMADSSHILPGHLQVVKVATTLDRTNVSEMIELMVRMLRQNRRLVKFNLEMSTQIGDPEAVVPHLKTASAEFETESLCICAAPLGLREKIAFLSVVDRSSRAAASPAGKLDASVLAIVLQFAGTGRIRDLRFRYDSGEDE